MQKNDTAPAQKANGRPKGTTKLKFKKKDIIKVESLAGYGLTKNQIADVFGISRDTFRRYMDANPVLAAAVENGISKAAAAVSQSAYQQAVGGRVPAMTMFWLKCRQRWKETSVIEHDGGVNLNHSSEKMTDEQRDKRIKELLKDPTLAAKYGIEPTE